VKEDDITNWKTINITPVKDIYKDISVILYEGVLLSVVMFAVTLAIGLSIIQSIMKPLAQITEALGGEGYSNRNVSVIVTRNNEFGTIANSINLMFRNIHELNRQAFNMQTKLFETELVQKESELIALQSKIDPHFLNNTLECMRSIATINKAKEISVITTSMIDIFRYSTRPGMFSSIEEEVKSILNYQKIIDIRYDGRIKIHVDIDKKLYPYSILKLLFQPLIENAIFHAIDPSGRELNIWISGIAEKDYGVFTVKDDGVGMSPGRKTEVDRLLAKEADEEANASKNKGKSHIGLANINSRIKLHFGSDCGLSVESRENHGTLVTIKILLIKVNG